MALTQEDVFRELELLPVWQLRQPAPLVEEVSIAKEKQVIEATQEVLNVKAVPEPAAEKIEMSWVLAYQVADDQAQAGQVLMQNIAKAMHLAPGTFVMLTNIEQMSLYQASNVVLFGQAVINAAFGDAAMAVESMRGKPQTKEQAGSTQYWVTDSIEAMLGDAKIKRGVWRDLQAAMAARAS